MSEKPFKVTLKTMKIVKMYSSPGESKWRFWLSCILLKLTGVFYVLGGSSLHFFKVTTGNFTELDISEDMLVLVGGIGLLIIHMTFTLRRIEWDDFLQELINFNECKESTKFAQLVKSGNTHSKIFIVYIFCGCSVYSLVDRKLKEECFNIKEKYHLEGLVCGTFSHLWLPFGVSKYFLLIISLTQYLLTAMGLLGGAMVAILTWEATRILGFYIDQLNDSLENIFKDTCRCRKDSLRNWINRHNKITEFANRLNLLSKQSIGHAIFISAAVCGCGLNMMFKGKILGGLIFLWGWASAVLIYCHAGQLINNKSESIQRAIYNSLWYKSDIKTTKDLIFILMRSQKPYSIQLLPIGTANYTSFTTIIRASYSYLMMLKRT